jgi:hypothetical protein
MIHAAALGYEGGSPEKGRQQEQKIASQGFGMERGLIDGTVLFCASPGTGTGGVRAGTLSAALS